MRKVLEEELQASVMDMVERTVNEIMARGEEPFSATLMHAEFALPMIMFFSEDALTEEEMAKLTAAKIVTMINYMEDGETRISWTDVDDTFEDVARMYQETRDYATELGYNRVHWAVIAFDSELNKKLEQAATLYKELEGRQAVQ